MVERLGVPLSSAHLIGWDAVAAWARFAVNDSGSNVWRAKNEELANYATPLHIAAQIADLYDLIQALYISLTTPKGRSPRPLKPYPRPWARNEQKIGRGAIPVSEFDDWYYGGENG